jgi:hypothetical protein
VKVVEIPWVFVLAGGAALAAAVVRLSAQSARLRETRASLQAEREDNQRKELELSRIKARLISKTKLLEEKSKAMPWIAEMVADIRWVHDERDAERLETKRHPAVRAAETVREHAQQKKRLLIEKRLVEYRLVDRI